MIRTKNLLMFLWLGLVVGLVVFDIDGGLTNLALVLKESVDVDHDGEYEDGDGDHRGRVPWEVIVRPGIWFTIKLFDLAI